MELFAGADAYSKQHEMVGRRKEKEKVLWANLPKVSKEDLVPSQEILDIVKDVEPMPEDVDIEKIKYDYLMKKYGWDAFSLTQTYW